MKGLIAKLKTLDYKQLAIVHGEKAVLGIVLLFVLIALGTTSWRRYARSPDEFLKKVSEGRQELEQSRWPDEQQNELRALPDATELLRQSKSDVELATYEYRTPFYWPLYPKKEKYKEPELLPVQDVLADAGYFIAQLAEKATPEELAQMMAETGAAPGAEATDGTAATPVAPLDPETAPRGIGPGGSQLLPGGLPSAGLPGGIPGTPFVPGSGRMDDYRMDEEEEGYGVAFNPMAAGADQYIIKPRGLRYVAVRGIFPLKEQIDKIAVAMHEPVAADAVQYLDFYDFVLERQTAQRGDDPWGGPWEKVDIQDAYDVLNKVVDYDIDLVDSRLTDAVFTMPLPYRVAGTWGDKVTHPKIKTLTEAEAEEQMLIQSKMIEVYEKVQQERQPPKRGFSSGQVDMRDVRGTVQRDMQTVMDAVRQELQGKDYQPFRPGAAQTLDPQRMLGDLGREQVSIAGQVLLFRYLDFNVEPGNAYRYRVRLLLKNPNYQRPIAELIDPSSAEGENRETPSSEPTQPVLVPQDEEVFLAKVERLRGRADISASLDVYQWYEGSGTIIHGNLEKLHAGSQVGGLTTTEVLRPAEQTFDEEEDVEIRTKKTLIDLEPKPLFDPTEHPDLELDPRSRTGLDVADQALVMTHSGEFTILDSISQKQAKAIAQAHLDAQNAPWASLRTAKERLTRAERIAARHSRRGAGRGSGGEEEGYDEEYESEEEGMEEMEEEEEGEEDYESEMEEEGEGYGGGYGGGASYGARRFNPLRRFGGFPPRR